MEEEKEKRERERETERTKLVEELRNRETEVRTINRVNQSLKEEIRELQKTQLTSEEPIQKSRKDAETQYEDGEIDQPETRVADKIATQNLQTNETEEVSELEKQLAKLSNEAKEREKDSNQKSKEIESLKTQVADYRNRLENALGESSSKEREIDHLTDSLDTLKRTNLQLLLQMEESTRPCEEGKKAKERTLEGIGAEKNDINGCETESTDGAESAKDIDGCAREDTTGGESTKEVMTGDAGIEQKRGDSKRDGDCTTKGRRKGEESCETKATGDIRQSINCGFGEQCKFWKMEQCRYHHPDKYKGDKDVKKGGSKQPPHDEHGKQPENYEEKGAKNRKNGGKIQCRNGKECWTPQCTFDHKCRTEECNLGRKCFYEHRRRSKKQLPRKDATTSRTSSKDQLDTNEKNYNGGKSEDQHAGEHKNKKSKNGDGEMQETLHFLMKEVKKMVREEMKEVKMEIRRRR